MLYSCSLQVEKIDAVYIWLPNHTSKFKQQYNITVFFLHIYLISPFEETFYSCHRNNILHDYIPFFSFLIAHPVLSKQKLSGRSRRRLLHGDRSISLQLSIRSVLTFLPWVDRIVVITDGTTAGTPTWLKTTSTKVKVVSYKSFVPFDGVVGETLNTNVIESYLDKVDELSERFLLMDEYTFFTESVDRESFVTQDNRTVLFSSERISKLEKNAQAAFILPKNTTTSNLPDTYQQTGIIIIKNLLKTFQRTRPTDTNIFSSWKDMNIPYLIRAYGSLHPKDFAIAQKAMRRLTY